MPDGWSLVIAGLVVMLAADVVNGWTGAPNAVATAVSSRVLHPSPAALLAAVASRTMINVALRTLW